MAFLKQKFTDYDKKLVTIQNPRCLAEFAAALKD